MVIILLIERKKKIRKRMRVKQINKQTNQPHTNISKLD
jgi:hypothetical protein